MRFVLIGAVLIATACSGGSDEPNDGITRIDGPAVVEDSATGGGADDPVGS